MKEIYIITGAAGFLGNNIIRKLQKYEDAEVRALVLPGDKTPSLAGLNCRIYYGDVTKKDTLEEIFRTEESAAVFVIHCAAVVYIKSKPNPAVYEINVNGTKNVIEKVLEKNAKLVYVSSVHAIPECPNRQVITETRDFDPDKVEGDYAKTKAEIARFILKAVEEKNLNACIVHPSGIIGPYDFGSSHLTQLIIDCANGTLKACVKGGYDFVDARDVAEGIISACRLGKKGECYILSNRYFEVRELLDTITATLGIGKIKTVLPMWLARLTAPLSEMYYSILKRPPLYTKYSMYTLTSNANFSNEKAKRELGYKTRDIRETVRDTVKWLRDEGRIK